MKSIQTQLILYFTVAILVPAVITSIVGTKLISKQVITRAEAKTISDLNSAREIYRNNISHIESITRLTAVRSLIVKALVERNLTFLRADLQKTQKREKFDILTIVDQNGVVVCRGRNPLAAGDTLAGDKFVARVIGKKQLVSGTDVVSAAELSKESADLEAQASIDVVPTPRAAPKPERYGSSGMMLKAAVPIFDELNTFRGVLIGGVLLNRNFEIVDKIKEVVHEGEVYKGKEIGTATIFQGDLRISTNVKNSDGTRAMGTLVSEEVGDAVLRHGERWVGEAFVVNDTYISAYEPIRDIDNGIIGILYVGILKRPFDDILRNTIITFLGIALVGILLIIFIAIYMAKRISRPLKELEGIARQVADGDYTHGIQVRAPYEVEHLGASINQMAQKLDRERQQLEEWGATLEKKVEERTNEIKAIHSQLFRSEKLASIGKLAAGVAHEINNPLTGILANSSMLLEDLPQDDKNREDVEIIVKETIRCREIVKRLLDFARQTKPVNKLANVNTLIENIILLVRNQATFRNITIENRLEPGLPETLMDTDQIQQVFINIILNAAEAMTTKGALTIRSFLAPDGHSISITFSDTGPGIPESNRERIFDPFFTTKEHGTGLGLSISYGIIEQHGGSISVDSRPGKGATFTVQLPIRQTEGDD